MKRIHTVLILITAAVLLLTFSCNIDGQGIYRTIEKATETDNPDLYRETASRILGNLTINGTEYLLSVTDGGVMYGYGDSWKTLEKTELMGGKEGTYTPKQDVVMAGTTLYALGLAEPVVYEAEASDINTDESKISWTAKDLGIGDFSKRTVHGIGVFKDEPFLVYSEFSDAEKKKLDTIVFLEDLDAAKARELYDASGNDAYRFSSLNVSDGHIYLSILTSGGDDAREFISFRFDDAFAVSDITSDVKPAGKARITGAVTIPAGGDDFITAFDPNGSSSHLYRINAVGAFSEPKLPAVFSLDRHATAMIALDASILLIAGRTGLYRYNPQDTDLPAGQPGEEFHTILKDKKINDFFLYGTGYQFYSAVQNHWVLKVDGKDNPASRL